MVLITLLQICFISISLAKFLAEWLLIFCWAFLAISLVVLLCHLLFCWKKNQRQEKTIIKRGFVLNILGKSKKLADFFCGLFVFACLSLIYTRIRTRAHARETKLIKKLQKSNWQILQNVDNKKSQQKNNKKVAKKCRIVTTNCKNCGNSQPKTQYFVS